MATAPAPDPESSELPLRDAVVRTKTRSQLYPAAWWGILLVPTLALSAGAGIWAMKNLLELPNWPQCRSDTRSQRTPSVRVYCAEQLADGKQVQDYRQAILLVSNISDQDPLYQESRRLIERWSRAVLDLGETEFQAGDLAEATKIAGAIPRTVHTHALAEERLDRWTTIWDRAEAIYQQAEDEVNQREWSAAMNTAKGLLTVGNQHWATVKHQELMQHLQSAKEMQSLQAKLQEKMPTRRSHAQGTGSFDEYFTRRDQERVRESAAQLADARRLAGGGELQAAIDKASQILYGTPHYQEAQAAVEQWRGQIEVIEDQPYLDRARSLAGQGSLQSIEAAIDEARQIGWGRPLYEEAYAEIEQWRERAYQLRTQQQAEQLENLNADDPADSYPAQPTSLQSQPAEAGEIGTQQN